MKIFREIGITILIAIAVFILLQLTMGSYVVIMRSMEPNFQDGECIIVNKVSYRFSAPQRGDVIIFAPPFDSEYPFIKRVIGLPDETVEIKNGKVFIDGTPLEEEYIMAPPNYTLPATKVPRNEYFVLGDNRNNSNDSRNGWTVSRDDIIGKAWFTYWPPNEWGIVKHYRPKLSEASEQEIILAM